VHSATFPITSAGVQFERVNIPDSLSQTKAFKNPYLK